MSSIGELLATAQLPDSDTALLDVELLLARVLGKSRSYLHTWPDKQLSAGQLEALNALLERRRQGEPIAYLLGRQGFWTLDLEVSPATLIPRADTERLVEVALELAPSSMARVLDLGTGTGAIALALASERPGWTVLGCDLQPEALALALENRQQTGLTAVDFVCSDWFSALQGQVFDLIVSNPPYIASDDPHLAQGDVRFEPASALVSGKDGLDAIRHIIAIAPAHLAADGWLLIEHGWQQGDAVRALLQTRGFTAVQSWQDLSGHPRVSGGQWHG